MRHRLPDILIITLLFALPLILFWPQTFGGRTLLPTENLYQFEPFATYREVVKAPAVPHNALLSDLVLENYQWKSFIRQSIAQGEIPLWNPHQFAGIPFMAAGQQSTLYPLSIVYYLLPLPVAYGWFTVLNLWLAGVFMFAFMRGIGVGRSGGVLAGVVYQLSGFLIASVVFPMIIGAAVWLPLLLLMTEFVIRRRTIFGRQTVVPWVALGAVALGCNILAGHVELTVYTLLITAYYAAARLIVDLWRGRVGTQHAVSLRTTINSVLWLLLMGALGFGLGALQFIPLFELVGTNWRSGAASFEQVLDWAHPWRDLIQYLMPNFYGNPSHHSYFDLFTMQTVTDFTDAAGQTINTIDWGIKNYVEGALYVGILPLALVGYGLWESWYVRRRGGSRSVPTSPPYRGILALLTLIALTFMFGLPTYIVIYILPGLNQAHTPFRWVYAVTLGVAVLAGFGLDALVRRDVRAIRESPLQNSCKRWARRFGYALIAFGVIVLAGLLLSRLFYAQIEPLVEGVFTGMAEAERAFSDPRMFYSYQFTNMLVFGVLTVLTGGVFWWAGRSAVGAIRESPLQGNSWQIIAIALVAVDLMIASWGFNPASDPALLDFTPPAIAWLQSQSADWRYTTLDDPSQRPIMQANVGWRYGLYDIRGYESIIPKPYVDYMQQTAPQLQLDFNRIAPLYTHRLEEVDWYRLSLLNVRHVITHKTTELPESFTTSPDPRRIPPSWWLAYEDEAVRIWQIGAAPRAQIVMPWEGERPEIDDRSYGIGFDVVIEHDTGREKVLHANLYADNASWLVVSETYMPGWRAFVRPRGGSDDTERALDVEPVLDILQGVNLSPEVLGRTFRDNYDQLPMEQRIALDNRQVTVRMVYSPQSFQVGLFGSAISVALLTFLLGAWLWRLIVGVNTDDSTTAARVARNSLAPIILNLFNRGIDFAFLLVMLRILDPAQAGTYFYLVVIFVWFDIFTNFGLDLFIIREVAREKARAGHYLYNSTVLRGVLALAGVPLLIGFLLVRQAAVDPALDSQALITMGLLYIGLFPASLSKGMTSLFYAYEQAEYPAAVATITTINKAVFGVIALLLGYGIVGLAGVSIVNNIITLVILVYSGRHLIGKIVDRRPDRKLIRAMTGTSWPLMLNHFLATIFFQVDIIILEALKDAVVVARYSVAYKWILAINIVPAFFTQALMPVMSRQAQENRDALKRNYGLSIKLLVSLALPLAVGFTFLAEPLTFIMGGQQYLPDGALALQLMIWSIPLGWMNSLTQYVLIALDLQRRITRAFMLAVAFNIVVNLIFIPQHSFRAAALTTIASEAVLLLVFGVLLHGALGRIDWLELVWRPLAATGAMLIVFLVGWPVQPLVALILAIGVYPAVLLALRPLDNDELALLAPLLPARLRNLPFGIARNEQ